MGQFKKYFDPEWPMPLISISSHDQYCAPPTKPEGGAFRDLPYQPMFLHRQR
jgi:hypothetical protein